LAEATIIDNKNSPNGKYQALGGNDFMVALPPNWWAASKTPQNTVTEDDLAGTMMHEFGHTLGLLHGGTDLDNFKPNYYSIMNYTGQMPSFLDQTGQVAEHYMSNWSLQYSAFALKPINMNATGSINIGFDQTKMVPLSQVWQTKGGGFTWAHIPNQLYTL